MIKYLIFMFVFINSYSYTIISERYYCSGIYQCGYTKQEGKFSESSKLSVDTTNSITYLFDQFGYQGLPISLGATHVFYAYNGLGSDKHIFKAKLCDMNNNCFNYEKEIRLKLGEYYAETIYSYLQILNDKFGAYNINASTRVEFYPVSESIKTAILAIKPFPYD